MIMKISDIYRYWFFLDEKNTVLIATPSVP